MFKPFRRRPIPTPIDIAVGLTAVGVFGALLIPPKTPATLSADAMIVRTDLYQPVGNILKRGREDSPQIALTFDDGPYPETIESILEPLRDLNIRATFFVVGSRVRQHPELVRRIVEDGHEIGNHTQHHQRLTEIPVEMAHREITECEKAIVEATEVRPTLLRPPGMSFNEKTLKLTQALGYVTVGWTNACKDYETEAYDLGLVSPEELKSKLLERIRNGSILLLHNTPETSRILPDVVLQLKAAGYQFVTISEMIQNLPMHVSPVERTSSAPYLSGLEPRSRTFKDRPTTYRF